MKRIKQVLVGLLALSLSSTVGAIGFNTKDANLNARPSRSFPAAGKGAKSADLQSLINNNRQQGAIITFAPDRTYELSGIVVPYNIHLRIPPTSTLKLDSSLRPIVIFQIGEKDKIARNVTIQSTTGRFTVDFRDVEPASSDRQASSARFVTSGFANNVQVRNVLIKDNRSRFNSVVPVEPILNQFTTRFSLRNIVQTNSNGGYGIMQVARVTDAYIRNLTGTGGVSLRLETHTAKGDKGITDLTAVNITGTRGRAAVMTQPHSADSIRVNVSDITSNSCAYGILSQNGFGRRVGKFTKTNISDATIKYGFKAQEVLFQRARYMTNSEWNKFTNSNFVKNRTQTQLEDLGESLPGISITGIFDTNNPASDISYSDIRFRRFPAGSLKRTSEANANNFNTVIRPRLRSLNQE